MIECGYVSNVTGIRISDSAQRTRQSGSACEVTSRMTTSEEELVSKTQEQLKKEASTCSQPFEGSSLDLHPPVEPIPDDGWEGETWGLFWPDLEEFDELKEDPEKFIKKHYEDKSKAAWHPPANLKAETSWVETLSAPEKEKPVVIVPPPAAAPPPATAPPPVVVLRPKKPDPVPAPKPIVPELKPVVVIPCPTFAGPTNIDNDNSKWSWMRSEDKSAGKARFSLSIYW